MFHLHPCSNVFDDFTKNIAYSLKRDTDETCIVFSGMENRGMVFDGVSLKAKLEILYFSKNVLVKFDTLIKTYML